VQDHEGIAGKFGKENSRMLKGFQADAGTGSSEVHCNGLTEVRSGVFSEFISEVDHAQELGMIPEEMFWEKSRGRVRRLNTFGDGSESAGSNMETWKNQVSNMRTVQKVIRWWGGFLWVTILNSRAGVCQELTVGMELSLNRDWVLVWTGMIGW